MNDKNFSMMQTKSYEVGVIRVTLENMKSICNRVGGAISGSQLNVPHIEMPFVVQPGDYILQDHRGRYSKVDEEYIRENLEETKNN